MIFLILISYSLLPYIHEICVFVIPKTRYWYNFKSIIMQVFHFCSKQAYVCAKWILAIIYYMIRYYWDSINYSFLVIKVYYTIYLLHKLSKDNFIIVLIFLIQSIVTSFSLRISICIV